MNSPTHDQWWPLHLKTARGARLTHDELAIYEAGRSQYENDESAELVWESAKRGALASRARVVELSGKHRELESQRQKLDQEIKELESRLGESVKQAIGVGD